MPTPKPQTPLEIIRSVNPRLADLTDGVLFGDIWENAALSKRDRSLITCAVLVAMNRGDQLKGHLNRALANGVTKEEINEMMVHLAFYAGWPAGFGGTFVAKEVFEAA